MERLRTDLTDRRWKLLQSQLPIIAGREGLIRLSLSDCARIPIGLRSTTSAKFDQFPHGRFAAMIRAVAVAFALGLAAATAAHATAVNRPKPETSAATNSDSAAQSGTAAHTYVRSECDTRRPSCRKWRSLAHDRIQNDKDGN
jgi:hypothetical protein